LEDGPQHAKRLSPSRSQPRVTELRRHERRTDSSTGGLNPHVPPCAMTRSQEP
jgi:hypothetical protein